MPKAKALVIVAHADDETLWMGATLRRLRNKYDWTICCVPQSEGTEAGKIFKRVCKEIYDAKPILLNCRSLKKSEVIRKLNKFNYDLIFTHNAIGETGHPTHIKVHNIIKAMDFDRLVTFWPYNDRRNYLADVLINLTDAERKFKFEVLNQYPSFSKTSKDALIALKHIKTEGFLIPKDKQESAIYKFYITSFQNYAKDKLRNAVI